MPHRRYDPLAVQRARDRIAFCDKIISYVKNYQSGSKDAIKDVLETIREMEFVARMNVDDFLKKGLPQGDSLARLNLGMKQAYQDVLTLFEKPEDFLMQYEKDKESDEVFLREATRDEQ